MPRVLAMSSNKIGEKVLHALKADPNNEYWLKKLSSGDEERFVEWLSSLFTLTCGHTKDEIIRDFDSKFELMQNEFKSVVVDVCNRIQEQVNRDIDEQDKRIKNLEHSDEMLKQSTSNQELIQKQTLDMVKMCVDSVNNLRDLMESKLSVKPKPAADPLTSILQKIPPTVWIPVTIGLVGSAIYILTGDDSLLKLGGGK